MFNKNHLNGTFAVTTVKTEYTRTCKISGSKKVAKCKKDQVCSAVLPHGKKCHPRGYGDCQLEPRCLTKREASRCDHDVDCHISRKACLLVEECDKKNKYKCAVWPRCIDLGKKKKRI
jgi:hypothetical protein